MKHECVLTEYVLHACYIQDGWPASCTPIYTMRHELDSEHPQQIPLPCSSLKGGPLQSTKAVFHYIQRDELRVCMVANKAEWACV